MPKTSPPYFSVSSGVPSGHRARALLPPQAFGLPQLQRRQRDRVARDPCPPNPKQTRSRAANQGQSLQNSTSLGQSRFARLTSSGGPGLLSAESRIVGRRRISPGFTIHPDSLEVRFSHTVWESCNRVSWLSCRCVSDCAKNQSHQRNFNVASASSASIRLTIQKRMTTLVSAIPRCS